MKRRRGCVYFYSTRNVYFLLEIYDLLQRNQINCDSAESLSQDQKKDQSSWYLKSLLPNCSSAA